MIAVVAHQRGQIEGDGQSLTSMFEQVLVALVGLLRRSEAGELPHRPHLAAIAGSVNAAGEGRLTGIVQILIVVPVGGKIGRSVQPANRHARDRGVARVVMLVEVHAAGCADGLLGTALQRRSQRLLRPLLLGVGRMTAILEHVGYGRFGDGFRAGLGAIGHELPHSYSERQTLHASRCEGAEQGERIG